jgi:hypothetical protein
VAKVVTFCFAYACVILLVTLGALHLGSKAGTNLTNLILRCGA